MLKKCKVVMLTTNEKADVGSIVTRPSDNRMAIVNVLTKDDPQPYIHQHLYILSDKSPNSRDWYIDRDGLVKQAKSTYGGLIYFDDDHDHQYFDRDDEIEGKIIAATAKLNISINTADSYRSANCLPQPSQTFIQKFVDEYNKGNVITEVMVEYEKQYGGTGFNVIGKTPTEKERLRGFYDNGELITGEWKSIYTFKNCKVNPKDNTITIRKLKDSWSREEQVDVIEKYLLTKEPDVYSRTNRSEIKRWIEENI
jgi:hypothetical protein